MPGMDKYLFIISIDINNRINAKATANWKSEIVSVAPVQRQLLLLLEKYLPDLRIMIWRFLVSWPRQLNSSPPSAGSHKIFFRKWSAVSLELVNRLFFFFWLCSGINCAWKKPLYLTIAWVVLFFFIPKRSMEQLFNYQLFFFLFLCHLSRVPNSKIVELEEELRVVGNNLKSLEVSEEKVSISIGWLTSQLFTPLELYLNQTI